MSINIKKNADKTSLNISGELTIYTAQEYKKTILNDFSADKDIDIDLSGVDEIDTSGLQLLAAMSKELENHGSVMNIIAISEVASDALETSCLTNDINANDNKYTAKENL